MVVVSCDKYSDLWGPSLLQLLNIKIGDGSPIYLVSNFLDASIEGVETIKIGEDLSWTENLSKALKLIKEEYLLILVDDFFLYDVVKEFNLLEIPRIMEALNASHLKFHNVPKAKNKTEDPNFVSYNKGEIYSVSVCGFWKKNVLVELSDCKKNAWTFEIEASRDFQHIGNSYSYKSPPFQFHNLVEKGKWSRGVSKKFLDNYGFNISTREFPSFLMRLIGKFKDIHFNITIRINWKIRKSLVDFIKKILVVD